MEYLIVLVLACISSPLSWSHYYAWMLLPIAFLLATRQSPDTDDRERADWDSSP